MDSPKKSIWTLEDRIDGTHWLINYQFARTRTEIFYLLAAYAIGGSTGLGLVAFLLGLWAALEIYFH